MYIYLLVFLLFSAFLYGKDFTTAPLLDEDIELEKGVKDTKHNLGEHKGKILNPNIEGDYGLAICVWCHTQNIDISFVNIQYKWAPKEIVKKFYLYGQTAKGPVFKNIHPSSLACLSCHDGANAPNIVIDNLSKGIFVHSHPVFIMYDPKSNYLKPINSPLMGWIGKKQFVYDLIKDYDGRIQCTSCHDPHLGTEFFLRTSTKGSKLCFGCHEM